MLRLRSGGEVLLALALLAPASACENSRELPITVILPADTSDYTQADNASIIVQPTGDLFSFSVDGLEFALELEGPPNTSLQQLELYLARGDDLIAWGSTVPFATAGADLGLALFLGRPGQLSTWPDQLDSPDPDLLAAEAPGRGMLLVQSDGDTFLLNHFTLELEAGARLPDTSGIAQDDGGLFAAANGSVVRLAYEQSDPRAWRYDPSADAWDELTVDGADEIGARPGAVAMPTPDQTRLFLLGGGGALDGVALDLLPNEAGTLAAAPVADFALDGPRDVATGLWLARDDEPTADLLLVGGSSSGPIAQLGSSNTSTGPELDWQGLACAQLAQDTGGGGATDVHVLCVGGLLDGLASADALHLTIQADSVTIEQRPDFLPSALPDPILAEDDLALYAQGEGRWFRIDREDESVSEPESAPLRARGGHLVSLANSVTFQVGGTDQDGVALDRWQVFTPAIEP